MKKLFLAVFLAVCVSVAALAQATAFTYQGKLSNSSGTPLTGLYDLQFKLFDADSLGSGSQHGPTVAASNVTVTAGTFAVRIDFGVCGSCFDGSARFLEISVKASGGGGFTTLSPRQAVSSTPYAIKTKDFTLNSSFNDGPTAFVATNTLAGENAGLNISPNPDPTSPTGKLNSFFGAGAGYANTIGTRNAFFGYRAGEGNATASNNAFFGSRAGQSNTFGENNVFFGSNSGLVNVSGSSNAFFGAEAGVSNTSGANTFLGFQAGTRNSSGSGNTFVGFQAGEVSTTGIGNTFIGNHANFNSVSDSTGDNNTAVGAAASVNPGVNNGTAIGAFASVSQNNSLVLGNNVNVGIGTTAPSQRLHVVGNALITGNLTVSGTLNGALPSGSGNYIQNTTAPQTADFNIVGNGIIGGNLGIGTNSPADKLQIVKGSADFRFGTTNGADGMEIRSSATGYSPALELTNTAGQSRRFRLASFSDGSFPAFFAIRDETAAADRLTIDHEGRIQIPASPLNGGGGVLRLSNPPRHAGISTESAGTLINFGINSGREGSFLSFEPGFWLRADARAGFRGFHFFKKAPLTGDESELMTVSESGNVGIGAAAPGEKFEVSGSGVVRARINSDSNAGIRLALSNQAKWSMATTTGGNFQIFNEATGQNAISIDTASNAVAVPFLASAGSTALCRNGSNQIATCSSATRYKTNIKSMDAGLSLIARLRPVTYLWKHDGEADLGLIAEEVAVIEPLLVTHNDKGEIEGVKYDRLNVAFINAFKEQQAQIEQQRLRSEELQRENRRLANRLEALQKLVCLDHAAAEACQ